MKTAVDTNVLLDILSNDPAHGQDAANAIHTAILAGVVAVCPVVYAELAASFLADAQGLDRFLQQLGIHVDAFAPEALRQAAAAWTTYLRAKDRRAQCPRCGHQFVVVCPTCASEVTWRQRVMPDFLVGAHALVQADVLLTRDMRTYSAYFPQLALRTLSAP
jgi:predicted nucleic acid-binding protein